MTDNEKIECIELIMTAYQFIVLYLVFVELFVVDFLVLMMKRSKPSSNDPAWNSEDESKIHI